MPQSGFNPKARWDRHIPVTSDFIPESIKGKIAVLAWFKGGKIYPRIFIWNNKAYKIKQITYNWQERQGQEILSCFSVNTGLDLYQISFNNTTLSWHLDKLIE